MGDAQPKDAAAQAAKAAAADGPQVGQPQDGQPQAGSVPPGGAAADSHAAGSQHGQGHRHDPGHHQGQGRAGGPRPKPTRVQFRHKFFTSVKNGCFRRSADDGNPGFAITLGDNEVLLSLPGIRREFGITDGSADGEMLDLVEQALDFVPMLKVGDPLPKEILTGEASWEVTERHRTIATQRVSMQLVTWISGEEHLITDPDQLVQLADDPRTRERVNLAFLEAAQALGWGSERKEDVVRLVGQLAEELSYIEAIREQVARVSAMHHKISSYRRLYLTDMSILEEISSCERFLSIAEKDYGGRLEEIDAQTGEIMALLKNAAAGIRFIREGRDALHRRLLAWQDILVEWEGMPYKRSQALEDLLRKTNRFLAPRFMPRDEWVLMSQLYQQREPVTARIW